jgi:hypothetical protein
VLFYLSVVVLLVGGARLAAPRPKPIGSVSTTSV